GVNVPSDGEMSGGQPQAKNLRRPCVLKVRRRLLLARQRLNWRRYQHRAQLFKRHLIPDIESEQSDHLTLSNPRHKPSREVNLTKISDNKSNFGRPSQNTNICLESECGANLWPLYFHLQHR